MNQVSFKRPNTRISKTTPFSSLFFLLVGSLEESVDFPLLRHFLFAFRGNVFCRRRRPFGGSFRFLRAWRDYTTCWWSCRKRSILMFVFILIGRLKTCEVEVKLSLLVHIFPTTKNVLIKQMREVGRQTTSGKLWRRLSSRGPLYRFLLPRLTPNSIWIGGGLGSFGFLIGGDIALSMTRLVDSSSSLRICRKVLKPSREDTTKTFPSGDQEMLKRK